MKIDYQKARQIVMDDKDAQYGKYVDLEMVLDDLRELHEEMTGEEAILRFLHELAKR